MHILLHIFSLLGLGAVFIVGLLLLFSHSFIVPIYIFCIRFFVFLRQRTAIFGVCVYVWHCPFVKLCEIFIEILLIIYCSHQTTCVPDCKSATKFSSCKRENKQLIKYDSTRDSFTSRMHNIVAAYLCMWRFLLFAVCFFHFLLTRPFLVEYVCCIFCVTAA